MTPSERVVQVLWPVSELVAMRVLAQMKAWACGPYPLSPEVWAEGSCDQAVLPG